MRFILGQSDSISEPAFWMVKWLLSAAAAAMALSLVLALQAGI